MRKAISIWAFTGDKELDDSFSLAKDAGFEGIELAYALDGPVTAQTTESQLKEMRALAESKGLAIGTLATGIFWQVNILSANIKVRNEAKEHIRHMLRIAQQLGAGTILVVPGFVGPFMSGAPVIDDYEATYKQAIEDFRDVARDAEKRQVYLGVENVWNRFLTAPFEMRDFVDAVGSEFVGVYFDVGNVLRTSYPQHWIKILGDRIKAVHLKDFKCNIGTLEGFVELLEGDVDYEAVRAALKAIGYDGWLTVEQFPPAHYPDEMIYRAGRAADVILGKKA